MTVSEELNWRGLVNQTTYQSLAALDGEPITFYFGVDPSAISMTIGNLAAAMMVKCLMKHGHKAVLLVGGATGMIGDPDGKASERDLLTLEQIASNKQAIATQYAQVFQTTDYELVDNYDWFKDMNYLTFLRDTGKHVPMRQMLGRDFIQTRLGEGGAGISYTEFSYVLIQAYDFLHLHEQYGVTLQVCGADQWGNSIAGVDLIRRKTGHEAHVYSMPLIINKATGRKFGKSEAGAVWLDASMTTATAFYQFWINLDDEGVEDYLKVYTELDPPTIAQVMEAHLVDRQQRLAQTRLAQEVTTLIHGQKATKLAEAVTELLVGKRTFDEVDDDVYADARRMVPTVQTTTDGSIVAALVASGLADSNSDARRLLSANAISLNGTKVMRDNFIDADFHDKRLLMRRGKAFKDSALVEVAP